MTRRDFFRLIAPMAAAPGITVPISQFELYSLGIKPDPHWRHRLLTCAYDVPILEWFSLSAKRLEHRRFFVDSRRNLRSDLYDYGG